MLVLDPTGWWDRSPCSHLMEVAAGFPSLWVWSCLHWEQEDSDFPFSVSSHLLSSADVTKMLASASDACCLRLVCQLLGSNDNKRSFLLPCSSPLLHPQTPSPLLCPFSSPHFFLCSSSHLCLKKEKHGQKNPNYWHCCYFQQWLFSISCCESQLLLPIIKQYLLMGGCTALCCQ